MPCYTYYMDHEVRYHKEREDPTVKELLDDIEKLIGKRWMVVQCDYKKGFFRRRKETIYTVMIPTCELEWQIINFPWEGDEDSIRHFVPRKEMLAFLMGVRIGAEATRPAPAK